APKSRIAPVPNGASAITTETRTTVGSVSVRGLELRARVEGRHTEVLTGEALEFVAGLQRRFNPERQRLLTARAERQERITAGELPDFLPETLDTREGDWRVAPVPADLQDRRCEITGPVDRKMIINALNSGAKCFMADFEDSQAPTWDGLIRGHINLRDAVRRDISFTSPEGKRYELNESIATLIVRPRGWHLPEKHLLIDGQPAPGALVDFGLYFFHNAHDLIEQGSGAYFSLPKLESHREAHLWTSVFEFAENHMGVRQYSI